MVRTRFDFTLFAHLFVYCQGRNHDTRFFRLDLAQKGHEFLGQCELVENLDHRMKADQGTVNRKQERHRVNVRKGP